MWNHIKSAFVFFCICLMMSAISFVVILGAVQMRKERVRLDYIHQYRIDKRKQDRTAEDYSQGAVAGHEFI